MEESTEAAQPHAPQEIDKDTIKFIEDYMQNKKPFLANILTLEQLATQMEMPPRTLSNIINRHFKRNFFEFINEYRIDEAKKQLAAPENKSKTIIDIMDQRLIDLYELGKCSAVDSRTTNSHSSSIACSDCFLFKIIPSNNSALVAAISCTGCLTVVNVGQS